MSYDRTVRIEFNHCDPAGIVFYPRYFEMLNSVVENFFRDVLDAPFEAMMARRSGVPTVRIEAEFRAPSRLGDLVAFALDVLEVGRSSARLRLVGRAGDEVRLTATMTLVFAVAPGPGGAPAAAPWPDAVRARLEGLRVR